jgi:hypothetical protein
MSSRRKTSQRTTSQTDAIEDMAHRPPGRPAGPIRRRASLLWTALAMGLVAMSPVLAQDTPASPPGNVYTADYFAATSPANAYDMLQRVPGFNIVQADADVRGYASAQGNVLIDGARPSSKREDIGVLLKRVPASTWAVLRCWPTSCVDAMRSPRRPSKAARLRPPMAGWHRWVRSSTDAAGTGAPWISQ